MPLTLEYLNACDSQAFVRALDGIYEHSPWIAERASHRRPFASLAALKHGLQQVVREASVAEQLGLIRAHPELAGKAAMAGQLTAESTAEQARAGLTACSADEFHTLQQLNRDYNAKFGFPFILAVKGPLGQGLTRQEIIATFARRARHPLAQEMAECLRQIGRIAELRLNDLLAVKHRFGPRILQMVQQLATLSESEHGLTCTYLSPTHQQTAARIATWMQEAGLHVHIDAVGNVRGRYTGGTAGGTAGAKVLLTGSHYDTVKDAGHYDGRLGIVLPLAILVHLHEEQLALPFDIEVIAFAEEEGVRFQSTFLGSRALVGQFDAALLDKTDAKGITLAQALRDAGHDPAAIGQLALDPSSLLGFLEVHIEQGPVLLQQDAPLGVVSAIAGSSRFWLDVYGQANHAGTTPMTMRHDAVAAAADIISMVEARCSGVPGLVGTVGQVEVIQGAMNVVAGHCRLSLDIRAADDAVRHRAVADIERAIEGICQRRGITWQWQTVLDVAAAPCDPGWQQGLADAIAHWGLPVPTLPSGAGHDAMMMANLTPMAMLFVRCGNQGISHNPLESMTLDDADLAAEVLLATWLGMANR